MTDPALDPAVKAAAKKAPAAAKKAAPTQRIVEDVWAELAKPFPQDEIEKLPKQLSRDDKAKSACRQGTNASADGHYCGGYHARSVHLDYVGHAGITMRLNDVVGPDGWTLEPMALDADGLPIRTREEFWVRLTILGVSKIEVAANFQGVQEALGDGLRRAASRFGVGTYLWSKSEAALALKRAEEGAQAPGADEPGPQAPNTPGQELWAELNALSETTAAEVRAAWPFPGRSPVALTAAEITEVRALVDAKMAASAAAWANPGPGTSGDQTPS